jgi:hypothetical protein
MNYIIPAILFVLSIAFFVGAVMWAKKYEFGHLDSKSKCNDVARVKKACDNDKNCCSIWDNGVCRKGTVKNNQCVSKGRVGPLILGILGIVLFISFFVTFMMAIFRHK